MPKKNGHDKDAWLRKFAVIGARAHVRALQHQIDETKAAFPELGGPRAKAASPSVMWEAKNGHAKPAPKDGRRKKPPRKVRPMKSLSTAERNRMIAEVKAGNKIQAVAHAHKVSPPSLRYAVQATAKAEK